MMMTTYAIAETVPENCTYLTAGKRYEVMGDNGSGLFDIVEDGGGQVKCLWRGCAHLNDGNWTRVEEEPATAPHGAALDLSDGYRLTIEARIEELIDHLRYAGQSLELAREAMIDAFDKEAAR